jgi:hypothetical protein
VGIHRTFCVSSVETLIKYYEILQTKKEEGKTQFKKNCHLFSVMLPQ